MPFAWLFRSPSLAETNASLRDGEEPVRGLVVSAHIGIRMLRLGFAVVLVWAIAAGTLRAVQVAATGWPFGRNDFVGQVLLFLGGVPFFAAGAFAAVAALIVASGLVGALFGFLFALPRLDARSAAAAAAQDQAGAAAA
ncbi:hypothetical protein, partial [Neoroseomonas soli]